MEKRCTNCGRFPFCEDDISDEQDGVCARWVKREVQMKLEKKQGNKFMFKEVQ